MLAHIPSATLQAVCRDCCTENLIEEFGEVGMKDQAGDCRQGCMKSGMKSAGRAA